MVLCMPFHTGFFHSGIGLYGSSRSFHGLLACVILALTISRCLNALQFMHPLTQGRAPWLLPNFGNSQRSYYKHLCAGS